MGWPRQHGEGRKDRLPDPPQHDPPSALCRVLDQHKKERAKRQAQLGDDLKRWNDERWRSRDNYGPRDYRFDDAAPKLLNPVYAELRGFVTRGFLTIT